MDNMDYDIYIDVDFDTTDFITCTITNGSNELFTHNSNTAELCLHRLVVVKHSDEYTTSICRMVNYTKVKPHYAMMNLRKVNGAIMRSYMVGVLSRDASLITDLLLLPEYYKNVLANYNVGDIILKDELRRLQEMRSGNA